MSTKHACHTKSFRILLGEYKLDVSKWEELALLDAWWPVQLSNRALIRVVSSLEFSSLWAPNQFFSAQGGFQVVNLLHFHYIEYLCWHVDGRRSHNGQNVFPAMALTEALIRVAREDAGRRPLHNYVTKVSYALDLLPYQQKSYNIYFLYCDFGV